VPEDQEALTDLEHMWVAAATVALTDRLALRAAKTGRFEVPERTRIEALETYCARCRKPYETVREQPCRPTEWLRGGPIGERKKRGTGTRGGQMVKPGAPNPEPRLSSGA
jgi:hypothetical protein